MSSATNGHLNNVNGATVEDRHDDDDDDDHHHDHDHDDDDVIRMAMRISMSAWSKLAIDGKSKMKDDNELLKDYIRLCPFVMRNSPTIDAAIRGIDDAAASCCPDGNKNPNDKDQPPRKLLVTSNSSRGVINNNMNQVPAEDDDDDDELSEDTPCEEASTSPQLLQQQHRQRGAFSSSQHGSSSSSSASVGKKKKKDNNIKTAVSKMTSTTAKKKHQSMLWCVFGHFLRTILFDGPILLMCLTYASLHWTHYVHDTYLAPQLKELEFTEERSIEEHTYYKRPCTGDDMTTKNGADLFLSKTASTNDAYEHQLLHGFTIFQNVLSEETATELRNYVLSKNHNLTERESIFVIEGDNRYSFGLGTEQTSVANAVMELANHKQLRPSLEKILGPNPALIEMTAITSSYGAIAQYWHDDVIPSGSAINFGRSFGPSYSIFIQLQNTTADMGATAACPGMHYCSDGPISDSCEENSFQVINGNNGYWGIGDALLMNMNSWHRGAAHIDSTPGNDRVMMILTFVPKPMKRAETRQMSQGITFSLRWDMWGHCLDDLANAKTAMTQPWATLRALGLYKSSNADWGIDYITSGSMRSANNDNGFDREALDEFVETGGFTWLPKSLHGTVPDDPDANGWQQFLMETIILCEQFVLVAITASTCFYIALFFMLSITPGKVRFDRFCWSILRLLMIGSIIGLLYKYAIHHVDNTGWAYDIRNQLRYSSTTKSEVIFAMDKPNVPTTFPTKYDVLIETRYGSSELAMYNDYINGHPGNRIFRSFVSDIASTYEQYPSMLRQATARNILSLIRHNNHGRFLHQTPDGSWYRMNDNDVIEYIHKQLYIASKPELYNRLQIAIRFLLSKYKYGIYRKTTLAIKYSGPYIKQWEKKLLLIVNDDDDDKDDENISTAASGVRITTRSSKPTTTNTQLFQSAFQSPSFMKDKAKRMKRQQKPLATFPNGIEPFEGGWIEDRSMVEGYISKKWWPGLVKAVSSHGDYMVSFYDGETTIVDTYSIRPFRPYESGEKVECYDGRYGNDQYYACRIMSQLKDDNDNELMLYSAFNLERENYIPVIGLDAIRRAGKPPKKKRTEYKSAY